MAKSRRFLILFGVLSVLLNCYFLVAFLLLQPLDPAAKTNNTFWSAFSLSGREEVDGQHAVALWITEMQAFLASNHKNGWGRRTGGVIVAGGEAKICGVHYDGNPIYRYKKFPRASIQMNRNMMAGGDHACKANLVNAIRSGWHQGQHFFYRLPVKELGRYTVRLALILYHQDGRRRDGVTLGLEDLMRVHLQCVPSAARYVVEPTEPTEGGESTAVIEMDTMAFGGEILLELEGTYTCVGLSLIELFYHEGYTSPGETTDVAQSGNALDQRPFVPVPVMRRQAAEIRPLQRAWANAAAHCASTFNRDAESRRSSQQRSSSPEMATEQRLLTEWGSRERLNESMGRYCRPHRAPIVGEEGWTWAGRSTRVEDEAEAARQVAEAAKERQARHAAAYLAALAAAENEGVSRDTAALLAAEAIDTMIAAAAHGEDIGKDFQESLTNMVATAARAGLEVRARKKQSGTRGKGQETRRRLDADKPSRTTGAKSVPLPGPSSPKPPPPPKQSVRAVPKNAGTGSSSGAANPTPPPQCPSRVLNMMERALRSLVSVNGSAITKEASPWTVEGAEAAAARNRGRVEGASGRPEWPERGAWSSLTPSWLARRNFVERGNLDRDVDWSNMAEGVLGSGFEAVAAYRAHDLNVEQPADSEAPAGDAKSETVEGTAEASEENVVVTARAGLPVWFTGFTWDGVTVVMKEIVPGCSRRGGVDMQDGARVTARNRACLSVESMFAPSSETVVDIIVPVSAGLLPRLLVLLPQMERLARGDGCSALVSAHPLAPNCVRADYYPPAFWPDKVHHSDDAADRYGAANDTVPSTATLRGLSRSDWRSANKRGDPNFRVLVATDDTSVERLLMEYKVNTVYVPTRSPFSKAQAIEDASRFVSDDSILFVHDADLFPPCNLPDALRQTVAQGSQAVNMLLAYENQGALGKCLYPTSTFGPIALYGSDYRAVGGMEDTNSGRWGFEDTAFIRKIMLGENALGVLRVHLPGLVHKWHEMTPWKCLVWTWGGSALGAVDAKDSQRKNTDRKEILQDEDPPESVATLLGF